MSIKMESSPNRFVDSEDLSVDDCDLNQLMADCEKWSFKNDLQLLSHLKQMSNNLINKTQNTNQSLNSLVFETKMHTIKVDNVINEFQMLANSQFVENRVYDEEVEDIITSGQNLPNDDLVTTKTKDDEILTKIKVALNISLDFMNQRFDCVSNKVPQNDSDDENDQILEGLISNSARDEYSQRLLPYIIGSEDFIKDNYVGLSCVEENPAIDLKTRVDNNLSVKSVDSYESKSDTSEVRNTIPIVNNFIDNMNDSEDESNDLFGTIPNILENNQKSDELSSDGSDYSDPFVSEDKQISKPEIVKSNEWKPSMPSFQDELSAAISAKNPNKPLFVAEESKPEFVVNESQNLESESSDESDSIFNINKTKPKIENKDKNHSNLFGEEPNDDSLFGQKLEKQTINKQSNKVLPNSKLQKIPIKTSGLFDDDDDEDDLFGAINKKVTQTTKPVFNEETNKSNNFTQNILENKKSIVPKNSLFSDDEEEDDLFSGISSKLKQNNVQNSDAFEPVVKQNVSSVVNKFKPTNSLIGELSSALKNRKLFQSDDEESDSNKEDDFKVDNSFKNEIMNENPSEIRSENQTNDSLFSEDNKISDILSTEVQNKDVLISNDYNFQNNDFYSEESTSTLSNDGLKHRAILGAKRNRRPPTKKLLKMTPITDLYQNSKPEPEINIKVEEKSAPIAAIRTVKAIPVTEETNDKLKSELTIDNKFKSMASLIKSPSTEEDDIFPTQTNKSKKQNISKIFEKSENSSNIRFNDSEDNDESLFTSKKTKSEDISKKVVGKKGIFDTSDSDDDNFFSNNSSNIISNIIKPSNSDFFNDVSSTDSSISNKSDLRVGNSKPTVSLFSDSDDEDLFSAVNKTKSNDIKPEKQTIIRNEVLDKPMESTEENRPKIKKSNSLFSDNEDDTTDLFEKKDIKTKSKPIFDLEDEEDDDEDIFAPKTSSTKTSILPKSKPKKENQSSDLFDDPLFVSRS